MELGNIISGGLLLHLIISKNLNIGLMFLGIILDNHLHIKYYYTEEQNMIGQILSTPLPISFEAGVFLMTIPAVVIITIIVKMMS